MDKKKTAKPDPFSNIHYPPDLPISQRHDEIVSAIQAHQVIILSGETGSGKTTQIPKMCLDAGLGLKRKIACTQPRRVAALSVAKRVSEELGVDFGAEVGAKIRFTDQTSKRTRIKFMTDGMLLSEVQGDPLMRQYDAVIIDEAHERSLNIDFLLGHLNQLRKKRPDLKIIITSATIDTEKFSVAFNGAPIIEVSGRVYPVEVIYAPLDELLEDSGDFTYLEGVAESTQRIQDEFGHGDILVFLPTEKDIREAMDTLHGRFARRMEIIPCYGRLSNADQQRIFQTSPKRKLILATNIAETSLTIPGIRFVIDAGLARISRYNPRGRTLRLPIINVSQSSANQRKGRCGRVADGICIRLYSEKDFHSRPEHSTPEIQRSNLADVILRMLASRLGDIETFPFIDPPTQTAITAGYSLLAELGAINPSSSSTSSSSQSSHRRTPQPNQVGASRREARPQHLNEVHPEQAQRVERAPTLTKLGQQLSRLPVDPTVGRMLLEAQTQGVVEEVLVIASALSIQDPRDRPLGKEAAAKTAHAQFNHPHSDFLTLLNIWEALHDNLEKLSQGRLRKFCKKHFLNYLRIREWRDIHTQLKRALPKPKEVGSSRREDHPKSPTPNTQNQEPKTRPRDSAPYQSIHLCLLTGLLANPGRREETNLYRCSANRKPLIFPGSGLFIKQAFDKKGKRKDPGTETGKKKKKSPEWIMAGEIVETNRLYARTVAAIDPQWLLQVGSHIITRSYSQPDFQPKEGRVTARESTRIHGLEIQNKNVSYLKVNPDKATEIFIREALLNEDWEAPHNWTFLEPNRRLMRRIQNAQTVISVAHWMGVEEAAYQFYKKNLTNIASISDLNRLLKSKVGPSRREGSNSPQHISGHSRPFAVQTLLLSESDLTASEEAAIDLSQFPESIQLDNTALPIEYHYQHGHEKDGVTLKLPYHKTKTVNNAMLDWLVPGHLEAKTHALLKALPKPIRQRLQPLAETAKTISKNIRPTGDTLIKSLSNHLEKTYSIETYASDWDESVIPDHLKARVEIYDKKGNQVAQGRDIETLQKQLADKESELSQTTDKTDLWRQARDKHERPIDSVNDLKGREASPRHPQNRIQIGTAHGLPIYAYPALRESTSSPTSPLTIHYSLFRSQSEATASNRSGIASLIQHECRRELAWIQSDLKEVNRLGPIAVVFRPLPKLREDVYEHIRQTIRTHTLDTLDPQPIQQAVEKAKTQAKGLLYKIVDHLRIILEKRQSLILQPEVKKEFLPDIDRLLPDNFLRHTPNHILPRISVYLTCIEKRLTKRANNPTRDTQQSKQLNQYRTRLADLEKNHHSPLTIHHSTNLRFQIEEFAISLFAQELGTAYPISAKKLDQAFATITQSLPGNAKPQLGNNSPSSIPPSPLTAHHSSNKPTKADLQSLKNLFG